MGQDSFLLLQRAWVLSPVSIWDGSQLLVTLVPGHPEPFTSFRRHPYTSGAHKSIVKHSHTQTQTHKYIFKLTSIAKMKKKSKWVLYQGRILRPGTTGVCDKMVPRCGYLCAWQEFQQLPGLCSLDAGKFYVPLTFHPNSANQQCLPYPVKCVLGDDKIIPDHLWLRTSWLVRQLSG